MDLVLTDKEDSTSVFGTKLPNDHQDNRDPALRPENEAIFNERRWHDMQTNLVQHGDLGTQYATRIFTPPPGPLLPPRFTNDELHFFIDDVIFQRSAAETSFQTIQDYALLDQEAAIQVLTIVKGINERYNSPWRQAQGMADEHYRLYEIAATIYENRPELERDVPIDFIL